MFKDTLQREEVMLKRYTFTITLHVWYSDRATLMKTVKSLAAPRIYGIKEMQTDET